MRLQDKSLNYKVQFEEAMCHYCRVFGRIFVYFLPCVHFGNPSWQAAALEVEGQIREYKYKYTTMKIRNPGFVWWPTIQPPKAAKLTFLLPP